MIQWDLASPKSGNVSFLTPPKHHKTSILMTSPIKNMIVIPSGYVNIAIENGPFIVVFPIKNGDFPWLC